MSVEPDVCSICLDCFTDDDPGKFTACGHPYHLQCIMQWAQRSRECPLCFKPLVLQEEELNALLPFGEFMPHEARQSSGLNPQMWMGLDAWELERLLSRLTSANQNNTAPERRRLRLRPRFRNLSLHPSGEDSKSLREGSGTEHNVEAAGSSILDFRMSGDTASSSRSPDHSSPNAAPWSAHSPTQPAALSPRTPDGNACVPSQLSRSSGSSDFRVSGESFKSRWGAVSMRCRETLNKTTRDLKNRLSKPSPQPSNDAQTNGTH
ncbi:hypothetical protein WJX74_005473 [Apatococcus lobatus]|uniref:RING-type E3 ubiquitin transferase n=1 Tax=Apatococcus lobatus TaxID=904363 RepID=A0AAW1S204_9CHLO